MKFKLEIAPLNLDQTLGCGQTFRWRRLSDGLWEGPLGDQLVRMAQSGSMLEVEARPGGRHARRLVQDHLRASDDVREIQRKLAKDAVLASGISHVKGLRIVKMDEWECLISFVLATYANIPRITKMIETLSSQYGEEIADGIRAFPTHARLSEASRTEMSRLGLGYRAGYIHSLCKTIDDESISRLGKLSFSSLREELKELPGVGDKVADCVSLFGFGRLEAFPIDVHIERALARLYHKKGGYSKLRTFASERFGEYAGYAQEYLFYNERSRAPGGECLFSKK
jgi:N-glycosylase/DNA lyase